MTGTTPFFTLTVACSSDGLIARAPDDAPHTWASDEEQELFFRDVEAADWAIMGRNTHLAADKPHRRRIIFSTKTEGWERPTQVWLDPAQITPAHLPRHVKGVHALQNGLILGGTRVHDWFLSHRASHKVNLTIEPIRFGHGLKIFSDQNEVDPIDVFRERGFAVSNETDLNTTGTRYIELEPCTNL